MTVKLAVKLVSANFTTLSCLDGGLTGGVSNENSLYVVMASDEERDMSKENDFFPNQEYLFHPIQRLSQSPSLF